MIFNWELVSSGVYKMISLICFYLGGDSCTLLFLHIVSRLLLVVFSARHLNILCSSLTSYGNLGIPRARQKLETILNGRPGSGICHFHCSLLAEAVTSQSRFTGRGKKTHLSKKKELNHFWPCLIHHKGLLNYGKLSLYR